VLNDLGMHQAMTTTDGNKASVPGPDAGLTQPKSAVFHRHLDTDFLQLDKSEGNYLLTSNGRKILDGSGGAAVASVGWGQKRVAEAIYKQVLAAPYSATIFYTTQVAEDLCRHLINSTNGHMARAYIVNSGR
jgi:adenosylmethionine-8-amino-7-oxononanoate aminotransferase